MVGDYMIFLKIKQAKSYSLSDTFDHTREIVIVLKIR